MSGGLTKPPKRSTNPSPSIQAFEEYRQAFGRWIRIVVIGVLDDTSNCHKSSMPLEERFCKIGRYRLRIIMTLTVVTVGTNNRLKVSAARKAFIELFDNVQVFGVNTPTDVPNQPWDGELYLGAKTRAESAMRERQADYAVGIEAGIVHINGRKMNTACAVILNQRGIEHLGYSVMFEVPKEILELVEGGMELSKAVDSYTSMRDRGHEKGLVGILSHGHFDRERMLHEATLMALMGFFNVI